MKRILIAFLALSILVMGVGAVAAQLEGQVEITPIGKVYAAWQPFEKGVMIWWSDLDQIWVLINPTSGTFGQAYIYKDNWDESKAIPNNGTPPANRFAPTRGFGYIWGNYQGGILPSNQLGWALAPELGYDSASRTLSGSTILIGGPGDTEYRVTFIPTAQANVFNSVGTFEILAYH